MSHGSTTGQAHKMVQLRRQLADGLASVVLQDSSAILNQADAMARLLMLAEDPDDEVLVRRITLNAYLLQVKTSLTFNTST